MACVMQWEYSQWRSPWSGHLCCTAGQALDWGILASCVSLRSSFPTLPLQFARLQMAMVVFTAQWAEQYREWWSCCLQRGRMCPLKGGQMSSHLFCSWHFRKALLARLPCRERQFLPQRAHRGIGPGIEGPECDMEQGNRSLFGWAQTERTQVWASVAVLGTESKQQADEKFICCHLVLLLQVSPKIFSQACLGFMISSFLVVVAVSICVQLCHRRTPVIDCTNEHTRNCSSCRSV